MAIYRTLSNGHAPAGLSEGDQVVTAGGTYKITGVNADGTYKSTLANAKQTLGNYAGGYEGTQITGVTEKTQQKLGQLEQGYAPSAAVQQAQQYLQSVQGSRPGAYSSQWTGKLQEIYDKITSRQPFSYDLNGDMLYQQYKDQYTRLGQAAMMDTMGQAANLTGGYGNTYAQNAGQQAYQSYLANLNDVVPQLYNAAMTKYQNEGSELYNRANLAQNGENADYQKYRDTVSDYYNDVGLATNAYNTAQQNDYNQYTNQLSYWQGKAANENSDYWTNLKYQASLASAKKSGGSGGSGSAKTSAGTKDAYGLTASQETKLQNAAANYFADNPSVALDSRTLDMWLAKNGYADTTAQLFKAYLQKLGATYSRR
jgi:hypothetical protein